MVAGTRIDTAEIRRRYPLADVAARYGIALRPSGGRLVGRCPFHEDRDPSLTLYVADPADEHFHCCGCWAHGDVIRFVERIERLPFRTAVAALAGDETGPRPPLQTSPRASVRCGRATVTNDESPASRACLGVAVEHYHRQLLADPAALAYCAGRRARRRAGIAGVPAIRCWCPSASSRRSSTCAARPSSTAIPGHSATRTRPSGRGSSPAAQRGGIVPCATACAPGSGMAASPASSSGSGARPPRSGSACAGLAGGAPRAPSTPRGAPSGSTRRPRSTPTSSPIPPPGRAQRHAVAALGVPLVALGRRVEAALARDGLPHRFLIHPAARGAIRRRDRYQAHVAAVLTAGDEAITNVAR
jgi:hypothetical protein